MSYVASTITFENPPPAGKYAELKLLIENAPIGSGSNYLSFAGRDISGNASTIRLDPDINLAGTVHDKQYSFTIWTKDGGENYFVYPNGSTYGWDIS